jgi:DNA-binding beta-propeller fold protein YncE
MSDRTKASREHSASPRAARPAERRSFALATAVLLVTLAGLLGGSPATAQNIDLDEITANDEFRWGVMSLHNGRINEAIASLNRSLSFDSDRPLTRYWLGRAYYYGGFEEAALQEWRWVAENGNRTAVLDKWIERLRLSRGLTTERLGTEVSPGRYVTMVDMEGRQENVEVFRRPTMVRPRSDGYFYVASFGTHSVVLIDPNGVRRQVIDGGIEGLDRPFDVYPLPDGSLLVSEFGADRIARISPDGLKTGTFGGSGVGEGALLGPQFLAGDGEGHLYVSDYGNSRVAKFTTEGEFLFSFGGPTRGFGGLSSPAGIVVADGRVYVADSDRASIQIFDESGNLMGELRAPQMTSPEGLSLYSPGELLVSDGNLVYVIDIASERVSTLAELNPERRILGAVMDANRNLLATDFRSSTILFMAASEELYTGLNVEIDFVNAVEHPRVFAAVTVTDRNGRPVLGLGAPNFRITEDRFPTGEAELVRAGYRGAEAAVSIVVDRAPSLRDDADAVRAATMDVYDALETEDRLWVVEAGEQPLVAADPADGRLDAADAAVGGSERYEGGRIDLGIRLAVSQLLGELGRRAVIVVSDGSRSPRSFERYSLAETAQHLANNHVGLWVIYTSRNATNPELDYLAEHTGGSSLYVYQPRGAGVAVGEAKELPSGSYMLEYDSVHNSDFGRRYIPLEVEAYLLERSGRDEAGYFGPLEF